jgi:hypothetical protein
VLCEFLLEADGNINSQQRAPQIPFKLIEFIQQLAAAAVRRSSCWSSGLLNARVRNSRSSIV